MITAQGLKKLGFKPDTDFELQDDGAGTYIKEWKSGSPQPTESEIETAHATAQTEYDAKEYARNRAAEYPTINELIVALWENVVEERTASVISLETKRQAVKTKYPKA
jgi:hypothetical protein